MHASQYVADPKSHRIGLAIAIALHVGVFATLLSIAPVRPMTPTAPHVMMTYIIAPVVETPKELPKPLPVRPIPKSTLARPIDSAPPLAIIANAPVTFEAPAREVVTPLPSVQEPPTSALAAPTIPPTTALAAPTVPPALNADYLDNPAPAYPPIARRSGEQGRVLLHVLVTAGGLAQTVELRTSSGSPRLDNAALDAVKRWRFVPARRGDQPVAAWVLVPIDFTLAS